MEQQGLEEQCTGHIKGIMLVKMVELLFIMRTEALHLMETQK